MHRLENQLRSWKPRHPSPDLKRRALNPIAAADDRSPAEAETFLPPWRWWAPVTAIAVGALTLLTGQFSILTLETRGHGNLIATAALNQPNIVAYLPAAGHSEANAWPGASFEWTNQGTLVSYTNR